LDLLQVNCAKALVWLGWLWVSELFGLRWRDICIVRPEDSFSIRIPANTGGVLIQLSKSTKSNQMKQANVIITYKLASGLCLGGYLEALHAKLGGHFDKDAFIFQHLNGTKWTSGYFHNEHVFPILRLQCLGGNPYFQPFDGSANHTFEDHFYSMHSYRHGGRTHVG
jgi:hypothetical protein